jgi:SpoIIAA-like
MTMLERLQELPPGIDGVKAVGRVSKEDYERVFDPLIDGARRDARRLRLLYQFGPEFEGFSPGAAWEDAKLGLASLRLFDGLAVVTDVVWIRESTRLIGFVMPCPVRVFGNSELSGAVEWLRSLPEGPAVAAGGRCPDCDARLPGIFANPRGCSTPSRYHGAIRPLAV